uniref:Uncharacterized protein n=1 Tax=Rhizophora mucronata TaxID=61149 RepID=A0A2P2N201_RHIMU
MRTCLCRIIDCFFLLLNDGWNRVSVICSSFCSRHSMLHLQCFYK